MDGRLTTYTGPHAAEIDHHALGEGGVAAEYADPGECDFGDDEERDGVY